MPLSPGAFVIPILIGLVNLSFITLRLAAQTLPSTQQGESRYSRQPEQEIAFQQGLMYYTGGRVQQAESQFRTVISADPGDAEAFYFLGLSQLDQNRPAEAIASFDQSVRLDPTSPEVRAARATANIRMQRFEQAEEDLNYLAPLPAWAGPMHYLRGQLAYARGDLKEAAREFAAAKDAGGAESLPASFYEGLTYLRMRELIRARSTFREASLGADRDPTVAAASRQLDAVLAAQQRRDKPWEVQLTTAIEWDSNVILIGSDIPSPEGISDESDLRFLIQPRGSYSFYRKGNFEVGVEGSGYFTWHNDLDDFDVESYQGGPYVNYRISQNVYASARYGYNLIRVGQEDFLGRHLVTPQLTFIQPKFGYTSAFYQFQDRDFDDSEGDPDFDRDGQNHGVGIVQGINLPSIFKDAGQANLELSYRFEHQSADGDDFDGDFHTFGATLYTPLPFFKLRADLGVSLDIDRYSEPNSLDASGDKRDDEEFSVVVGINREINRNWTIRADYIYTDHNSNVDQGVAGGQPFDYDRHQVGLRAIFSY
jgi:tetratricopeptide (TPR) repeat protein